MIGNTITVLTDIVTTNSKSRDYTIIHMIAHDYRFEGNIT